MVPATDRTNTPYKWFYGDVWAYFAHKHVVVDLYADYQRLNWSSYMASFTTDGKRICGLE